MQTSKDAHLTTRKIGFWNGACDQIRRHTKPSDRVSLFLNKKSRDWGKGERDNVAKERRQKGGKRYTNIFFHRTSNFIPHPQPLEKRSSLYSHILSGYLFLKTFLTPAMKRCMRWSTRFPTFDTEANAILAEEI